MPVAGGVDEGVGDGFARAEALYQRRGVVERVGVGAVGVQGQGSVKPGLGNLGVNVRVSWISVSCGSGRVPDAVI